MRKNIEQFLKLLILLSFFVPLVLMSSSFIFPFIVPKIVIFRSIVLLMFGSYLALLFSNWHRYKPKLTAINIAVFLFFLSFTISTFVGVDPYKSFWDNHERMLGLFTVGHYVIYYFIISSVFKDWLDWKLFLRLFLGAGLLVMFIGFIQKYLNVNFLLNGGSGRVSATLGNAIYFSAYGMFLFFIGYLLMIKEKTNNFWRYFAIVGMLFGFGGVFWGGTRSAFLGLTVGLFVMVLVYLLFLKKHKKIRLRLSALVIFGVLVLSSLFFFRQTDFVKNIPAVGRLMNVSLTGGTADTRIMAWGIAYESWKDKPIFGWGPNNYFYAFNKYYNPNFLDYGFGETWFDNAHNILMNTLAVQGAFGILTYLSLFIVSIIVLFRAYKKGDIDIHFFAVGTAFLIGHLVNNVFVFENPTSYLYFFFFLALLSANSENKNVAENNKLNNDISVGLVVLVFSFIFIILYATNINPAKANKATLTAIKSIHNGDNPALQYQNAIKIPSPHIDDIRADFSRAVVDKLGEYIKANRQEEVNELYNLVYEELSKNLELHPLDIRVHLQLANMTKQYMNPENKQAFENVELLLEDALSKSPKRQQVQYVLAEIKIVLGKDEEAEQVLIDSLENNPKIEVGLLRLIALEQEMGKFEEGLKHLNYALDNGIVLNENAEVYLNSFYPDFDFNKNE
ncbi:MAG: O-antigen ligase family protein [Candidatus Magasanikbacteria bacterium]|nr:O-antigen ligase family protein [Candidatus Magasanikbacteria bacterium]